MVLRLADIESGPDQKFAIRAGAPADDLRAQRVGAQQAIGAVLFGGADGDQDGLGAGKIGLDLRPGGKMKLHSCLDLELSSAIIAPSQPGKAEKSR